MSTHFGIRILRGVAVVVLVAGSVVGVGATRAPAPAWADNGIGQPLLLVHGFNDDCQAAFNTVSGRAGDQSAYQYLWNNNFRTIDEVGYYTSSARNTWANDANTGVCNENLNSLAAGGADPNMTQCNQLSDAYDVPQDATAYGTKDDRIDRLGCLLAWYIFDTYTRIGQAVNVLAHSMGGLVIRDAIGRTSSGASHFPPAPLWVLRVVTVATPHGGIGGLYRDFASGDNSLNGKELDDMQPGSAFMNMIGGYSPPQGAGGTQWSLMGASDGPYRGNGSEPILQVCPLGDSSWPYDGPNKISCGAGDGDGVVPISSQMAMKANYKVTYGGQTSIDLFGNVQVDMADAATQYEHEIFNPTCSNRGVTWWQVYVFVTICWHGPFYLNDAGTATTTAWVCTSSCNDTNIPSSKTSGVSRSLATIVSRLNQPASAPGLSSSPLVLRSASTGNGLFVSAELGYSGSGYAMMRARASALGSWESWTKVNLPGGFVALRNNANSRYASVDPSTTELHATATGIGKNELFKMISNPDGTYSLRSQANLNDANNRYVSAELGFTGSSYGELRARATAIGSWEKYTQNSGSLTCTNYPNLMNGPNSCSGFSTHSVWFSDNGAGLYGQGIWTYAHGTVADSTATYQLSGMDNQHVWQLQAYIPNCCSDASNAHYHYCSPGGGCADGYVNQNNYTNQWANFGAVCTTDGTATVVLADDGGDAYPAAVGADAIRAVRLSFLC